MKEKGPKLNVDTSKRASAMTYDEAFRQFFPVILREASDERNFVRKAVNWAVRQIGKRDLQLNAEAIAVCEEMRKTGSKSARWIAADALRELQSDAVRQRLEKK